MFIRPEDQLEQLLGMTLEQLDIPPHLYLEAVDEYQAVGDWLCRRYEGGSHAGCEVYVQGSFRLGTVVRPVHNRDEYDLDLVCRRDLVKESITQAELKEDVGAGLADCEEAAAGSASAPTLKEGDRCWTLVYPSDRFHMDVLPAIPDAESVPNSILLTDRSLRHWQHSNPIDYAAWFHRRMQQEFIELRQALAKAIPMRTPCHLAEATLPVKVSTLAPAARRDARRRGCRARSTSPHVEPLVNDRPNISQLGALLSATFLRSGR